MKVRTDDLNDQALDWACLVASGKKPIIVKNRNSPGYRIFEDEHHHDIGKVASPSTDGGECVRMIENLGIALDPWQKGDIRPTGWIAALPGEDGQQRTWEGCTVFAAVARCHVGHHLGREVEIPDELLA